MNEKKKIFELFAPGNGYAAKHYKRRDTADTAYYVKTAILLFLAALILAFTAAAAVRLGTAGTENVLSKYGSRGEEVRKIQTKLKNWGYYSGSVDGIYGTQTKNAVIYFQRKNGLTADGIAGPKTLAAMGISSSSSASSSSSSGNSSNDLYLLARIISGEARGEPYKGQVAVGAVILNRVKHPSFPNTISGVIYQSGAFEAVANGQYNVSVTDSAYKAAQDALNGWDPTGGCIYYFNPAKTSNAYMHSLPVACVIGNHYFSKGK